MSIIPEWAPSIHPMVVHFPIALLSLAVLIDLASFFLPKDRKWWPNESTLVLYGLGALSAIIVYFTGKSAADSVFLPTEAQSVLNTHADWALWTVWFFGVYALARILFYYLTGGRHRRIYHVAFFVLALGGFFLLYQTGDNGARMVFEHGVGVEALENRKEDTVASQSNRNMQNQPLPTAFNLNDNGDWTWEIEAGALQVLRERFRFVEGGIENLNAETVMAEDSTQALQFSGNNLNGFFVSQNEYQNVQADYYLDMADFKGTVTLVNHVQDSTSYDYVSIASDGTVEQGRMINGEKEVFEQGSADVSSPIFVRVVANGTHFRGYVDKEMIVHGHGDAPQPGPVGMKLVGSGTLLLKQMELAQL